MWMVRLLGLINKCKFWLSICLFGGRHVSDSQRHWLVRNQNKYGNPSGWKPVILQEANLVPWVDLLNRPAGGHAYCGGVLFKNTDHQPQLRHWRGQRAIDTPLFADYATFINPLFVSSRLFWCGPLAFHFGHQIADFGTRVLLSSLDPRNGDLLWYPWRSASEFELLKPWQRFLLNYLNPGMKRHLIATTPIRAKELVVYPQQAPMRSIPSPAHLEALTLCEKQIRPSRSRVLYVSRTRFAPCRSEKTLIGAFAAEERFEEMLEMRGVKVIYPESLDLRDQLSYYRGADAIIVAEGSAQHGLELLGFQGDKPLVVICRRHQLAGMNLPLKARFPLVRFVEALQSQWQAEKGVQWNGLAILDWIVVASVINPLLAEPLTTSDCLELKQEGDYQLSYLASKVVLRQVY